MKRLCPSPKFKITFSTPSKNFEAYFVDFDIFLRALKRLCAYRKYKITFLTPSKNFEADFLDFDIFHIFSKRFEATVCVP